MENRVVPVDIIFSRLIEGGRGPVPGSDVPIVNLDPHLSAVRFVLKGEGSLDGYWEWFHQVDPEGARSYSGKRDVWEGEVVKRISSYNRPFWVAPPVAAKLERDRLILQDGNLRCAVAKVKGKSWIKVSMPEGVAAQWDRRPTEPLQKIIAEQNRKEFYAPVMHPDYRRWKTNRPGSDRLDIIRRFLGPIHTKRSVLEIGCNMGYYAFHLARQGFEVVALDFDPKHLNVAKALKEMYSLDVDLRLGEFQKFPRERRYDLVLGMTVFWHLLGWGDIPYATIGEKELGEQLEALVGHAILWESGVRAEEEIEIIRSNSGLKYYTRLADTEGTGVQREMGVFTRRPLAETQAFLRNG